MRYVIIMDIMSAMSITNKHTQKERTRLIIVGGFLGAGKTTLLGTVALIFSEQKKAVGLITNDQAADLVDTRLLVGQGEQTVEVAGSCFCCNFDGLMEAAISLRDKGDKVIIAEPVGS